MDQTDVVVVGGGLAGCAAALSAAEAGAEVVLLEKTGALGGNAPFSGGFLVFAGTDLQTTAGIDDGPDVLREDFFETGLGQNLPGLVDAYVQESLEVFGWLRDRGVVFEGVTAGGDQSRPRSHIVDVRQLMSALIDRIAAHAGIEVVVDSAAEELRVEAGAVVGVRAGVPSGALTVRADATVLATGGFNQSRKALATFAPRLLDAIPLGNGASSGDGLYMAMKIGADLADMGTLAGTYCVTSDEEGMPAERRLVNAMYHGAISVNREGRRFVDESISYKVMADVALAQTGSVGFQVFDEQVMATSTPGKPINDFREAFELGYAHRADTIAELAAIAGIDPDRLIETVDEYNSAIREDRPDRFGRTSIVSGHGALFPLDHPPYYALPSKVALPATYGGIRADRGMRVLDVTGVPITGLYAAGEITGGLHGGGYISGTALGKAAVFGRIAGREAAGRR